MRFMVFDALIGCDAEIRHNFNGDYMVMRVVSHEYLPIMEDEKLQKTDDYWFDVISSNPLHIKMSPYLTKGRKVAVAGKYTDGLYFSGDNGTVKIDRKVRASEITFLDSRKSFLDNFTNDENNK